MGRRKQDINQGAMMVVIVVALIAGAVSGSFWEFAAALVALIIILRFLNILR